MTALILIIAVALLFDLSNGFHDASNSIATLVATGTATPRAAIALAGTLHLLGPLLLGTAVADTVGGIIDTDPADVVVIVGAALAAALTWNVATWALGLPSSSSHALVGGLVGGALVSAGTDAVNWGGMSGMRPSGVLGVLFVLAASPLIGALAGLVVVRALRRSLRRATRRVEGPVRWGQWLASGALAFSQGANDAQKTMGVITLLLVTEGHLDEFSVPIWVKLASAGALTVGTALGGWRIVRTIGRGIFRLHPSDALASQSASAGTIFGAALAGAPVSTTHVVSSSVVGVGVGRSWRRVRWGVVHEILLAWVLTLPATAALSAALVGIWTATT